MLRFLQGSLRLHNTRYGIILAGMPKVVDHDERRREILEATWQVVAREGLGSATVRRIAEEACCTTGLVTHYFASKDEILVAALRRVHVAAGERMARHLGQDGGLKALEAVLLEALPMSVESVLEWRVWMTFWGQALSGDTLVAEQARRYREWRQLVQGLLRSASARGELRPRIDVARTTDEIVALVDGLGIQASLEPRRLTPARLRSIVRGHLAGLAQPQPPARGR
jgi:AcrR family transcriptional regulator